MTRTQAQTEINELYAKGKIDQKEWSKRFDELSSSRWDANGPVTVKQQKEEKGKKKNEQ